MYGTEEDMFHIVHVPQSPDKESAPTTEHDPGV